LTGRHSFSIEIIPFPTVVSAGTAGRLGKMRLPVRLELGSPVGSGRQYLPWIHIGVLVKINLGLRQAVSALDSYWRPGENQPEKVVHCRNSFSLKHN